MHRLIGIAECCTCCKRHPLTPAELPMQSRAYRQEQFSHDLMNYYLTSLYDSLQAVESPADNL